MDRKVFPVINYEQVIDDSSYTTVMEAEAFDLNLFEDLLTGTGLLYDEVFKDKIVIVGATMPTLQDFHPLLFPPSISLDLAMRYMLTHSDYVGRQLFKKAE